MSANSRNKIKNTQRHYSLPYIGLICVKTQNKKYHASDLYVMSKFCLLKYPFRAKP
jgi:hypothetical protein